MYKVLLEITKSFSSSPTDKKDASDMNRHYRKISMANKGGAEPPSPIVRGTFHTYQRQL